MMRNITILKAKGPDQLWVKEIPGPDMSHEAKDFQNLVTRMNQYCNYNDTLRDQIVAPTRGQYCLARRTADRMWYRAKIETMLQTSHGTQAHCMLVDYAEYIQVSVHRMYEIPEEFLELPFQAKDCRLHGIQPLTLTMSFEDFTHSMTPCTVWDTSAVEFFNEIIKDKSAQMTVHSKTRDDVHFITLYINVERELVNVNEELVRREFAAVKKSDDLDDYEARAPSPAPSLEAMALRNYHGSASSREGSIRALSPEMGAYGSRMPSPPSASRLPSPPPAAKQVSPGLRQQPDEQQVLKSKFQDSLKMHKVSVEGLLEKRRHDDHGREHGKQGSPSQPMEVLSTAQVREKIQQLGMPLTQSGTVPRTHAHSDIDYSPPGPAGDNNRYTEQQKKDTASARSPVFGQSTTTPPKGRGLTLQKYNQMAGSDSEKKGESQSPVGNHGRKSPADGFSPRGSGPGMLPVPQSQSALSPLSSDFSSGDESKSDRKQKALALLQQMAAKGKTRQSSEYSAIGSSDSSTHVTSPPHQVKGHSPETSGPSPDSAVNRPPFRIRPPTSDGEQKDGTTGLYGRQSGEEESLTKSGVGRGAMRKTIAAKNSHRPSAWSDEKQTSCSSSDEVGQSPSRLPDRIIEQRINLIMNQPTRKNAANIKSPRARSIAHGVLLHGDMPPEPFTSFEEAPFLDTILRTLQKETKFVKPSAIQSYSWAAILRGRDMIGVSGKQSGKKLAYLLPILQQVKQPSMYSSLPVGCGPLAIVVTPGWERASDVYSEILAFIGSNRKPKALLLHGAGSEVNNQVQLINGVDIVICTISCLLRLLQGEHTNLERLCHLVLDDADILFEDFTAEVKELVNEYAAALVRRRTQGKAPSQQMVFASTWTPGLRSYLNNFLREPAVIIAAPLEAAVYARIKWMAKVTSIRQRFQHLVNVIDSCQAVSSRVVVFVNRAKDGEDLQKMLVNAQYYSLLAHRDMGSQHIVQVISNWKETHRGDSVPVLVMTDDVIHELGITNASCVVHYDFPTNKSVLGRRLGTMMDNFASQMAKKQNSSCQTMLLLLEADHSQYVPSLSKLLARCSRDLASQLGLEEAIEARECKKTNVSLCHNLKGLGYCWDYPTCPERHWILPSIDSPGSQSLYMDLPQSGLVKVLFTYIVDASCFHGRILEYRPTEGSAPVDMTTKYAQLPMDMAMWFGADAANKQIHGSPQVNELCAFEDDQRAFHRVRVVKLNVRSNGVLKNVQDFGRQEVHLKKYFPTFFACVQVQFVDEGRYLDIHASKLLKLPARFHSIPFQAIEVYICKVKPVDKDRRWTEHADRHINNQIYRRTLEGKIALSLGNTVWLDPLVERVYLEDLKSTGININVRQELLDNGFAETNPEHLSKLRQLCKGKIELPMLVPTTNPDAESISTILVPDTETITGTEVEVYVSAVAYPSLFYVQKCSRLPKLEKLMSTIETKMESIGDDSDEWNPQVGDICLARFQVDGRWSRGCIKEVNESGEYDVFFVDYGDSEWHLRAEIRRPWNDILKLPFQALECSIADIGPVTEQWEDTEGDAMWEMCSDVEVANHTLTLKVISTECSDKVRGISRYIVDLYDKDRTERYINIGHQLVLEGHARGQQGFITNLFPNAANEEKSISVWLIKLCRQLYEAKDKKRQMEVARAVHQLVTHKKCDPDELCTEGALVSLCHLVYMLQTDEAVVYKLLVRSLIHVCYNNTRNCREMCRHGGLKQICQLLPETNETTLQEQICWILKTCAGFRSIVKKCIREYGGVHGLCQLLTTNGQRTHIINSACACIGVLATDNPRNQDLIKESGGVAALCQMLATTSCSITQEEVLRTLSVLATHIRNRDGMRTEGGIKALCNLLWESEDDNIILLVTQTLLSLVTNKPNRRAMLNEELDEALEGYMMQMPFSETTMGYIGLLFSHLTERDRDDKRITSDNLEEFGLLPVQDNQSVSATEQINQSESGRVTANQSEMVNGIGANQSEMVNGIGGDQSEVVNGTSVNQSNGYANVNGHSEAVEMPDDMPPLEEDEDIPITATPSVQWSQTPKYITLRVLLRGVTDFDLEVYPKGVQFSTQLDHVVYSFHLNLYSSVNITNYEARSTGGDVLITLCKETPEVKWSRLIRSRGKLGFVSYDWERYEDSSDDDPLIANKKKNEGADKPKRKPPKIKRSKSGAVHCITPEMDTGSESDYSDYTNSTRSSEAEFGTFADESNPVADTT
ncbi:uncharacterized protein [Amphiura filiformis]|uniref:uncharacterized protein n=1 Tax=Amphiura filiformis TaxID=82378 RepID=UPI003B2136C4